MFLPSAASQQGLVCPPLHHQPLFLWHHILSRCAWLNCDIKHIRPVTNWAAITFPILPICGSPSGRFSVSVLFNEVMKSIRCFLGEGARGKVSIPFLYSRQEKLKLVKAKRSCTSLLTLHNVHFILLFESLFLSPSLFSSLLPSLQCVRVKLWNRWQRDTFPFWLSWQWWDLDGGEEGGEKLGSRTDEDMTVWERGWFLDMQSLLKIKRNLGQLKFAR